MKNLIVVSYKNQIESFTGFDHTAEILTAKEYLNREYPKRERIRVFNLCNDYDYCKKGYYVSLLAEARGHRPFPDISSISDFQSKESQKALSSSISETLTKSLKDLKSDQFELSVYFGKNLAQKYQALAKQIFNFYQSPLIRVYCSRKDQHWTIKSVRPISYKEVPKNHREFLQEALVEFFGSSRIAPKSKVKNWRYDIAILCNPDEALPPSNEGAIRGFMQAAKDLRLRAEIIGPKDIALLSRFDGLFIRETTNVFDHTFKFAKKAELEGLVVIDDPQSILRCCNKVFLHDLLMKKRLSVPKTWILHKDTDLDKFQDYPLIIKKPDSAFSAGVKKVNSLDELIIQSQEYFKQSDLLILQEFMKTDFDWRIGVLNNEAMYACRYYMAPNHWQIIKREGENTSEGEADSIPIEEAPPAAVQLALAACKEIGTSLYGVDIKEKDGQFYIIEVNDNPSIEKGYEDLVLGQSLYQKIMTTFLTRLESR